VTAFFWLGSWSSAGGTNKMFTAPSEKLTEDYITGGSVDGVVGAARPALSRRSSNSSRHAARDGRPGREQVRLAVKGLVDRDRDLIARVLIGDGPLNSLHIEVDNRCFTLLALYQPMAVDLRAIVAAVKINTDLERVGDLAINIAEAARQYVVAPAGRRS
jgi:phosphate uptake regulator